jgi:DNA-binding transcriptional regulator YhcF (GntR family)
MSLPLNIALREWFENQEKFKTRREFAEAADINYNTMRKYFAGNAFPQEKDKEKLYTITKIECLSPAVEIKKEILSEEELLNLIKKIRSKLYQTEKDLEYFLNAPASHREKFRESLNLVDVGFIASFIRALCEEERFQTWLKMNTYKIRR